jgi:heme-degrading monooxygenase HmoA
MLFERAELTIREGQEEDFGTAMQQRGVPLLKSVPGVVSVSVGRGVENPGKFLLLVHWENMTAHAAFGKAAASRELREIIGPFSKGGSMEHFEMA